MFKKLFFLFLSFFSINTAISTQPYPSNYEKWTEVSHLKDGALRSLFNRAVIGDCPEVGHQTPLEERKKIIQKLHEEIQQRGLFSPSYLKEMCSRKTAYGSTQLCIDYLEPEVAQLLIDLGYSTHDILSSVIKKLEDQETTANALAVFSVIQKNSPMTEQEKCSILEQTKKQHKPAVEALLEKIRKTHQPDDIQ